MEILPREQWEHCSHCGDQGFTIAEYGSYLYATREMALDAGVPELEGAPICEPTWTQIQCEFCWTNPKSFFNQMKLTQEKGLFEEF